MSAVRVINSTRYPRWRYPPASRNRTHLAKMPKKNISYRGRSMLKYAIHTTTITSSTPGYCYCRPQMFRYRTTGTGSIGQYILGTHTCASEYNTQGPSSLQIYLWPTHKGLIGQRMTRASPRRIVPRYAGVEAIYIQPGVMTNL